MNQTKTIIPDPLREDLAADPFYQTCSLFGQHGHRCEGRITWEHAIISKGRKVQLKWAIIPLCAAGHSVDEFQDNHEMVKELNEWVALSRATDADILALTGETANTPLSKARMTFRRKEYLIGLYGSYKPIQPVQPLIKRERIGTWRGKEIDELPRVELLDVIRHLIKENEKLNDIALRPDVQDMLLHKEVRQSLFG